jgi:hypothetical protein
VFILKNVENLFRNKTQKINLVDISLLSNCNNVIKPKDLKPKCIQKILNPRVLPKAKIKWENKYDNNINWGKIWGNLKKKHILKIRFQSFNGNQSIT